MANTGVNGQLETLAHRVVEEVLNDGSEVAIRELLAEDLVLHGLGAATETRGRDAFAEELKAFHAAVPDAADEIESITAAGDTVVLFCTRRGTLEAPYGDVPAAGIGRSFEVTIVHKLRVEDGLVVEWWRLADALGMARQLGVLPDSPGALVRIALGELRHRLFQ